MQTEPSDHSDEAAQQAGCGKQLTHIYLEYTPSLFPQLRGSLRCCFHSYTIFLSDHMSQPTVFVRSRIQFVIVISAWHAFDCFGYFSFQSSFLGCTFACCYTLLLVSVCVCAQCCDKYTHACKDLRLCLCAAALAFWPPVEEEWHSSKQEMKPYKSPCVCVCVCAPCVSCWSLLCILVSRLPLLVVSPTLPGCEM